MFYPIFEMLDAEFFDDIEFYGCDPEQFINDCEMIVECDCE